jgi:hypothetical protein
MRKIELQNYMVNMRNPEGNLEPKPYNVKDSMVSCLLHGRGRVSEAKTSI